MEEEYIMEEDMFDWDDNDGVLYVNYIQEHHDPPVLREAGPPFPWWSNSHLSPPNKPVFVGLDKNDGPLYVGRSWHTNNLLPAKVAPTHHGAFVAWDGKEHSKFTFEVLHLLRGRADWVEASDGDIPAHAFPVGLTVDGRAAYVGRVHHDGTVTPGRLLQNDDGCYISYAGEEIRFKKYEVLIVL